MKKLRKILSAVIWMLVGIYVALLVLLQLSPVQGWLGHEVAGALSRKLGTEVTVGNVNLGFLNRIIIDDVRIPDQSGHKMITIQRLAGKIDVLALLDGRISVESAQVFSPEAALHQQSPTTNPNYQFLLDSLASKDTTSHTPLDLRIGSLIIRKAVVAYDRRWTPAKQSMDANHIKIRDLSTHLLINRITDDSLNINIKRLSLVEQSGLEVKDMKLKAIVNNSEATISDFMLALPHSILYIPSLKATYKKDNGKLLMPTLSYEGEISKSVVNPSDLAFIVPALKYLDIPFNVLCSFYGSSTSAFITKLAVNTDDGGMNLLAKGNISGWDIAPKWYAAISRLDVSADMIGKIAAGMKQNFKMPEQIRRMGHISFIGNVGGRSKDIAMKGILHTDAGRANIGLGMHARQFTARVETNGFNLGQILDSQKLGMLATRINIDGTLRPNSSPALKLDGVISRLDYNNYSYRGISVDANYDGSSIDGLLESNDPNASLRLEGDVRVAGNQPKANITAHIHQINPSALHLWNKYPGARFSFDLTADVISSQPIARKIHSLNAATGAIRLNNLTMRSPSLSYDLGEMEIKAYNESGHHVTLTSDFANASMDGYFDYASIDNSIAHLLARYLPTLPGLPRHTTTQHNEFTFDAELTNAEPLQKFLGIPLSLPQPLQMHGSISDRTQQVSLHAEAPYFSYDGTDYADAIVDITTPDDTLRADVKAKRLTTGRRFDEISLSSSAASNKLEALLNYDNHNPKLRLKGKLNTTTQFFRSESGHNSAHINIHQSAIGVGDTLWQVQPSDIIYSNNRLTVDHFAVNHGQQHLILSGIGSADSRDSLVADLKDVNIGYILDLIHFDAVSFGGNASGRATVASLFASPKINANLNVTNFIFQGGQMGTLVANAHYNVDEGQIDIDGTMHDGPASLTFIKGYVSPKNNDIDLNFDCQGTHLDFVRAMCDQFCDRMESSAYGKVRVVGPLNRIQIVGDAEASGSMHLSPTNVDYYFTGMRFHAVPDTMYVLPDTIADKYGNQGLFSAVMSHEAMHRMKIALDVKADRLLAFDTHKEPGSTFWGTVYATGDCHVLNGGGSTLIDFDGTPTRGSEIVYNVATPEALDNGEFIHWGLKQQPDSASSAGSTYNIGTANDRGATRANGYGTAQDGRIDDYYMGDDYYDEEDDDAIIPDIPSDLRMNLSINATPEATLKVIMDDTSGDYIALNGSGGIKATWFNKGDMQLFGTYTVDHGIYKLTIQNAIKKDFQFKQGGTIAFHGNAFGAALNLNALYPVNGVSLSDLNLGTSFRNNIRVDCLMNITGTPGEPKVDFSFDLPNVDNDIKQMVYSVVNSEGEMNQQVIYLLAVGRFMSQGNNNQNMNTNQTQTSLAMQSLLSGTISQQINTVLSSMINNNNWTLGANISTGDDGFNNAEYEGLLSGRMLNNRLLFSGQFGYRDNPYTNNNFIGDFDLRYLLTPSGNFAVHVYNQTNDRYFTRNSLTTQGLGFIIRRDFVRFSDLFKWAKTSKKNKK